MSISRSPFVRNSAIRLASYLCARMARYPALRTCMIDELTAVGCHVEQKRYDSPIPDESDLTAGYWDEISDLPGVKIDPRIPIAFIEGPLSQFLAEFRQQFGVETGDPGADAFTLINGVYMAVDAHIYYALVRYLKPKRIIEVGSGQSTRLAVAAARRNRDMDGAPCAITAIEPYPPDVLRALASDVAIVEKKLQVVDRSMFDSLGENDILFIDSTHVLREGSDVQAEYLEILPRLRDGVHVHVHDISLPERYPRVYFEHGTFWNEQHLLQAFLAFNDRFEVIWPGNWMMVHRRELMSRIFPEIDVMRRYYPASEPTAFWMRTRGAGPRSSRPTDPVPPA